VGAGREPLTRAIRRDAAAFVPQNATSLNESCAIRGYFLRPQRANKIAEELIAPVSGG
tara:strand:- start:89 stop:262 length:174 start_codon:yes stop_codon:yes gene_type:complete